MAEISASLVKQLREQTGAGMMDCKRALTETEGKIDGAVDWLRKKGISGAVKKSTRIAADGLVGVSIGASTASLVEVNSETDFVSRNDDFQNFVSRISKIALDNISTLEDLKKFQYDDSKKTVEEKLTELVGKIGENIVLRRLETMKFKDNTFFSSYVHGQVKSNLGKIGVIIAFKCDKDCEEVFQLGKQIAMHVAASKPIALSIESMDKNLVEREKKILFDQAKSSGKPEKIINQMVMGRISKFYNEIVLMEQTWVMDGETKLSKIIKNFENDKKCNFIIKDFKYFVLGEGIELEKKDFVSEVAEQANK